MIAQSGFDPHQFWMVSNPFQAYFNSADSLSQGFEPMKALARCQLEVMGLVSRRAQAYLEIPSRLSQCRTPQDILNEQMAFWRTAFEQYSESSQRIADAWGHVLMPLDDRADARRQRDYITFAEPKDGQGRSPRERRAA
jgi:hypothetical protein